jgi:hypothetical protein
MTAKLLFCEFPLLFGIASHSIQERKAGHSQRD